MVEFEVYYRFRKKAKEILIIVDEHIPFHKLVSKVPKEADRYFIMNRQGTYEGPLENACLSYMMGKTMDNWSDVAEDLLPLRAESRYPQVIPVVLSEHVTQWNRLDGTTLSVLQTPYGWDFYENGWILHKWEAGLSIFDDETLVNVPAYPKDIFNQSIDPETIIREAHRFQRRFGEDELKRKYWGMYLLTQQPMGRLLLRYFYEYQLDSEWVHDKWKVLDKMILLYESSEQEDPFRHYLLASNYSCLTVYGKVIHKPFMLMNQYLSYHGMFISKDFYISHQSKILSGIAKHYGSILLPSRGKHNPLPRLHEEMMKMYSSIETDMEIHWIGTYHLERFLVEKSEFWSNLLRVWNVLPRRNLYLWVEDSFRYLELQTQIGTHLSELFNRSSMTNDQKIKFESAFSEKK